MENDAPKRYWIFSRQRRERISPDQLPTDSIPAHKAGGNATYGAFPAVFEWFTLDDDRIGILEDDKLWDETESGEVPVPTTASAETAAELESFTDVTLLIYNRLLEAEHRATPEDFQGVNYDMGNPLGYVRILREIWAKQER
jgi:hypothetical protein